MMVLCLPVYNELQGFLYNLQQVMNNTITICNICRLKYTHVYYNVCNVLHTIYTPISLYI